MDTIEIIKLLSDTPLALLLLYLLINEQRRHAETRKERDSDARAWFERYAALADRVSAAVERLDLPGPL